MSILPSPGVIKEPIMERQKEQLLIPKLGRREFFKVGATTFVGFHLLPMLSPSQAWAEKKVNPRGTAEFCIFLHLVGGPSQVDSCDIKEGRWTPEDFGIHKMTPELSMPIALFPRLSAKLNRLAIVRSAETWEGIHERGQYY